MSTGSLNLNGVDGDIEKVKKYKEAVDELQKSMIRLNSTLPSFADGMKAGLQAVGEKLPEIVESIRKLNVQNKELAASNQKHYKGSYLLGLINNFFFTYRPV